MAQQNDTLASKLHIPLAILACVAMAGFLVWLGITAEPTDLAMEDQIAEEELEAADEVPHEAFAEDPREWTGMLIRLTDIRVDETLGAFAFWANIPEAPQVDEEEEEEEEQEETLSVRQLFVLADRIIELREFGVEVPEDEAFELVGEVRELDPQVIEAWTERGIIPQAEAEQVTDAETYIIVHQLPEIEAAAAEEEQDPGAADGGDPEPNDDDTDADPDL